MQNGVSICNQFCWEACWPCSAGKPNTGIREAALHPSSLFIACTREGSDDWEEVKLRFHGPFSRTNGVTDQSPISLLSLPKGGPTAPSHWPSRRRRCAGPVASAAPAPCPVPGAASESPSWGGHSGSWPLVEWRPPGSCSCGSSGRPGPGSPSGCGP